MKEIIRAVAYIRVSSDRQAKEGDSLREQRESIQDYVNSHKNMVLVDTYIDDGISGQKLNRGEFQRLIDDVENDSIDLILFTKLDRWFRNLKHYLNIQEVLDKHNVAWIAIRQQQYDTSTAFGRAFVNMSMTWAELEAQNDSERILAVNANKVKNGEVISGTAPTGYKIVGKKYVPDEQSEMIIDMFNYFIKSANISETQRYLKDKYGFDRTYSTIRKKLKETKYIGQFRDNKNFCEPLIDENTFYLAQNLLKKNKKRNQKYHYVFSGLVWCKECEHRIASTQFYTHKKRKDGTRTNYHHGGYRCKQAYERKICPNKSQVYESVLERKIVSMIKPEIEKYIAEYEIETKPIRDNSARILSLRSKIEKLTDLYLNDLITMTEFKEKKESFESMILELTKETGTKKEKDMSGLKNILNMDIDEIYWNMDVDERNRFWRAFVDRIYIDKNRNIEIIFL